MYVYKYVARRCSIARLTSRKRQSRRFFFPKLYIICSCVYTRTPRPETAVVTTAANGCRSARKSICAWGVDVTQPPPLPARDRCCEKAIRAEYITSSCAASPAAVWRRLYTTNFCRAIGPRSSVYTLFYIYYFIHISLL